MTAKPTYRRNPNGSIAIIGKGWATLIPPGHPLRTAEEADRILKLYGSSIKEVDRSKDLWK